MTALPPQTGEIDASAEACLILLSENSLDIAATDWINSRRSDERLCCCNCSRRFNKSCWERE